MLITVFSSIERHIKNHWSKKVHLQAITGAKLYTARNALTLQVKPSGRRMIPAKPN